eukprot:jgi/Chrzof1/5384/Cz16g00250.t1
MCALAAQQQTVSNPAVRSSLFLQQGQHPNTPTDIITSNRRQHNQAQAAAGQGSCMLQHQPDMMQSWVFVPPRPIQGSCPAAAAHVSHALSSSPAAGPSLASSTPHSAVATAVTAAAHGSSTMPLPVPGPAADLQLPAVPAATTAAACSSSPTSDLLGSCDTSTCSMVEVAIGNAGLAGSSKSLEFGSQLSLVDSPHPMSSISQFSFGLADDDCAAQADVASAGQGDGQVSSYRLPCDTSSSSPDCHAPQPGEAVVDWLLRHPAVAGKHETLRNLKKDEQLCCQLSHDIRGYELRYSYTGETGRRTKAVAGLDPRSPAEVVFDDHHTQAAGLITCQQYLWDKYRVQLRYPGFPCAVEYKGGQYRTYPVELLR